MHNTKVIEWSIWIIWGIDVTISIIYTLLGLLEFIYQILFIVSFLLLILFALLMHIKYKQPWKIKFTYKVTQNRFLNTIFLCTNIACITIVVGTFICFISYGGLPEISEEGLYCITSHGKVIRDNLTAEDYTFLKILERGMLSCITIIINSLLLGEIMAKIINDKNN